MRILFATDEAPKRAARKLRRVPPLSTIGRAVSLDVTAYCMGYKNWHELRQSLNTQTPDLLDDFVDDGVRKARRQFFALRLGECLAAFGHSLSSDALLRQVDLWSPLAADMSREVDFLAGGSQPSQISLKEQARRLSDPVFLDHRRLMYCRKYLQFFREMLDWPLKSMHGPLEPAQPFATTWSKLFNREIPLLAPAIGSKQQNRSEADVLKECSRAYPDGAILLVDNPSTILEHGVEAWSPGYFLTSAGNDRIHISPTTACFDGLFDVENGKASLRVVEDIGHWSLQTFQELLTGFRPALARGGYDDDDVHGDVFADWGWDD